MQNRPLRPTARRQRFATVVAGPGRAIQNAGVARDRLHESIGERAVRDRPKDVGSGGAIAALPGAPGPSADSRPTADARTDETSVAYVSMAGLQVERQFGWGRLGDHGPLSEGQDLENGRSSSRLRDHRRHRQRTVPRWSM